MNVLVTGGCGFIGSHFVRLILRERPGWKVVNLDALTYAGNPANLADVEDNARLHFVHGNIADALTVDAVMTNVDAIVNLAAQTHVDRSIDDPEEFLRTSVFGTYVLLEGARRRGVQRFVQVSTDEVYGDVGAGRSLETDRLAPSSAYSASKAAADLVVLAYARTYGVPAIVTRGSNTYGSHQHPEKFIPLSVTHLIDDQTVPIYGDGLHWRDWIEVEDHARAVLCVLERGVAGEIYNVGSDTGTTNLDMARRLTALCGRSEENIRHVADRPGHDRRYALDCTKLRALGWEPRVPLDDGLRATVDWYRGNEDWWRPLAHHPPAWRGATRV